MDFEAGVCRVKVRDLTFNFGHNSEDVWKTDYALYRHVVAVKDLSDA